MRNPRYPVNVKIPQEYVELIDDALRNGGILSKAGFKGRAHFVRFAVYKVLKEYGITPSVHPHNIGIKKS
jgi:Arc/MetJ-type ribon-helix-helix transcriptional regulator